MFQLLDLLQRDRKDAYLLLGLGGDEEGRQLMEGTAQNKVKIGRVLLHVETVSLNRCGGEADLLLPVD
jgi:hypothetical protein